MKREESRIRVEVRSGIGRYVGQEGREGSDKGEKYCEGRVE